MRLHPKPWRSYLALPFRIAFWFAWVAVMLLNAIARCIEGGHDG